MGSSPPPLQSPRVLAQVQAQLPARFQARVAEPILAGLVRTARQLLNLSLLQTATDATGDQTCHRRTHVPQTVTRRVTRIVNCSLGA